MATLHAGLTGKGPGLVLRGILRNEPQAEAVAAQITRAGPDVVLITGMDFDLNGAALTALRDEIARLGGLPYPHLMALRPNAGIRAPVDLNGDGRIALPADGLAWGRFAGAGGMGLLSRYPILPEPRSHNALLWKDLPGAQMPVSADGNSYYSPAALSVLPLSSGGHWEIEVQLPNASKPLLLMAFYAQTPVFDGPEDRNGLRNRDQLRLWKMRLSGWSGDAPQAPFVLLGNANLDPGPHGHDTSALTALLTHPKLQDPQPKGPNGQPETVHWQKAGRRRVSYVLPDATTPVRASGLEPAATSNKGKHALVWVDLEL